MIKFFAPTESAGFPSPAMTITSVQKSQAVKKAVVHNAPSEEGAIEFVMAHFNETRERLQDWDAFTDVDGVILVRLWTQ